MKCRYCKGSGVDPHSHRRYTTGGRDDRSCPVCHGEATIELGEVGVPGNRGEEGGQVVATTSEIPVTISADAEERVRELGMQREFEAMLEHTRQTVPGLCAIEISSFFFDGASEQCLLITASEKSPRLEGCDPVRREWYDWLIDTFPPAIVEWFLFVVDYETDHAG